MAAEIALIENLEDFATSDLELRDLWNKLESPILYVLDESGVNVENACVRHLKSHYWLYADDVDGFAIMRASELEGLALTTQKPE